MLVNKLKKQLDKLEKQDRIRHRRIISERTGNTITMDGIQCINFASNDYLGLANHPQIIEAFTESAKQYGFGSGSASLISGFSKLQQEVENQFAQWLNMDKAIFFNSGYLANIGTISALAHRSSCILADKLCHASLLDGIQLSRAKHYRYKHNDLKHLKALAQEKKPNFIITESVFSMEGDISDVRDIISIAKANQSSVVIDDAHGIGVLGSTGRGICEYAKLTQQDFACLIAPLGKAFCGMGAMVVGKNDIIEAILQFARSYRYTTALPPAVCGALLKTLAIVQSEKWRREKLKENIDFFIRKALSHGLPLVSTDATPIQSIFIGDNKRVLQLQEKLLAQGVFIGCIRPPTVPEHSARMRISLNALHTQKQLVNLLDCLLRDMEIIV